MGEVLCLVVLIVLLIGHSVHESKQKDEISRLKCEIDALRQYACAKPDFNEKHPPNVQVMQLRRQAEMLKFCFLCPLYQEKEGQEQAGTQE